MIFAAITPPAHVLKLADLRRAMGVFVDEISPDGRKVLVTVSREDYAKDNSTSQVLIIDVRTHRARVLLHDKGEASWSPDGSSVAFIDKGQLFVLPMDGGEATQITHEKRGVGGYVWRPDGRALAYTVSQGAPNQKEIDAHADAFTVGDSPWTAQSAPTPVYLYEISATGGKPHRIGRGDWSVAGGFVYSKDGRTIFVTRRKDHAAPTRFLASEIVAINVASGAMRPFARLSSTQSIGERARDGSIEFSFANPHGMMQEEIGLADANGQHPRWISLHLDRNAYGGTFLPDGSILAVAPDGTSEKLYRLTRSGAISIVPLGDLIPQGVSVSRNGVIALTAQTSNHPSEAYVLLPGSETPQRLTNYNNWISTYKLGVSRTIQWRTFDGMMADGVLTIPPVTHGGTAPLVLYIHGGPTGTSTIAYDGFVQVLAAHGWYVFQPNYRGSDNLGLAFAKTTVPHITSVPGDDIERGLAAVLKAYPIDRSRIAVSGWSEGGLLTSWLITHDQRWRAAVDGAAVDDWVQYDALTDAKDFSPLFIGKSPWTSTSWFDLYERESPLTYASNVRTPTLIMSDSGDYRVPTPLAYEFYHSIRATGTPVQFVIYPVLGHFPSDPVRAEDVNRRWEAWLAKYLGAQ